MKSEFKAKLIQHLLSKKNNEQGFTLIELLVVIIIIGILAAIALPSFLNQANKGKQSEARTYVGSLNKGQQGYYTEKSKFGTQDIVLGVGLNTSTANYGYASYTAASAATPTVSIDAASNAAYSTTASVAVSVGGSKVAALRSYSGIVSLSQVATTSDVTSLAVVCETNAPGAIATAITGVLTTAGTSLNANQYPTSGTACGSSAQTMGN
ncbi:MAG: type IV pilin-like G/H family protein [Pseudanabaena sp. ELA607]|jgi:prepilin-type N-terminal cleavage/methylation domain-containing protein